MSRFIGFLLCRRTKQRIPQISIAPSTPPTTAPIIVVGMLWLSALLFATGAVETVAVAGVVVGLDCSDDVGLDDWLSPCY